MTPTTSIAMPEKSISQWTIHRSRTDLITSPVNATKTPATIRPAPSTLPSTLPKNMRAPPATAAATPQTISEIPITPVSTAMSADVTAVELLSPSRKRRRREE